MKILMVHDYYDSSSPSGEGRSFEEETQLLRDFGHDVLTYVVHNDEIRNYGPLRRVRLGVETVWSWTASAELEKIVRETKREVVHFQNTLPLISPGAYWGVRRAGAAVVQSLRNFRLVCPSANLFYDGAQCERCVGRFPWPGLKRNCYRGSKVQTAAVVAMNSVHHLAGTWQHKVDRYIVAAEFTRERLRASGIPSELMALKPNYVPDPGTRASGQEYALFIGRLSAEKGISTLMQAWEGLNVPLRIVGNGVLEEDVARWAANRPHIKMEGRKSPSEIEQILSRAAFVVMPSSWNETFGRVILEAYASGLPAITTRTGAQQELVREGTTGWLFEPGDAAALNGIARGAWNDLEGTAVLGRQARAEYDRHYGAGQNHARLIQIYEEALAHRLGETKPKLVSLSS